MPRLRKILTHIALLATALLLFTAAFGLQTRGVFDLPTDTPSRALGTSVAGSLASGRRLPCSGVNFSSYSWLGCLLGRNSVHSELREIILQAYNDLSREKPGVQFVYGEMGWPRGGNFWPHKSHRNGLCADFFVPVLRNGKSVPVPAYPWNKFGYGLEFDSAGRMNEYIIDYEAMAAHILALNARASEHGFGIAFVILDNPLQLELAKLPTGRMALATVRFSKLPSWVRHDEHYHIEFVEGRGTAYNFSLPAALLGEAPAVLGPARLSGNISAAPSFFPLRGNALGRRNRGAFRTAASDTFAAR